MPAHNGGRRKQNSRKTWLASLAGGLRKQEQGNHKRRGPQKTASATTLAWQRRSRGRGRPRHERPKRRPQSGKAPPSLRL